MPTNPPLGAFEQVGGHLVRDGILSTDEIAELLAFAVAKEADFRPTAIGSVAGATQSTPDFRTSRVLPNNVFKPWHERLETIIAPLLPGILHDLGLAPFEVGRYEMELVRHNDGDFYRRHIDTAKRQAENGRRVVSLVYYFHAEPKGFEGGALRLYAATRDDVFVDVQPGPNRLVAFASWIPHEVMPISCPSGRFIDSRFAINCWVRMRPETSAATPAVPTIPSGSENR